jgi:ABC-type branched-subunit amino acid transport system permease subunit
MKDSWDKWVIWVLVLFAVLVLPFFLSETQTILAREILFWALFAVSFNLLMGFGGLLPFGHGALFGVGAYACGIILSRFPGFPILPTLLLAGLLSMALGAVIGFFSLRLKGAFFSLLTLAFQMFLFSLALKWRPLTGGEDGLAVTRPDLHIPLLGTLSLGPGLNFYFFSLVIVGLALALCYWILRTPFGNTIRLIRENEERAAFLGYRTFYSQLGLFVLASFAAGLAGGLSALSTKFVSLDNINIEVSFAVIMITFIGGPLSFWGPALGSVFYIIFQSWLASMTDRWMLFMGILFVFMVLYLNQGLISLFYKIKMLKLKR